MRNIALILLFLLSGSALDARTRGIPSYIPVADVVCVITTGNCTGVGAGTGLFTAATCNGDGTTDDAAAFRSFNTWAVGTWQAAHTGLIQLTIPSGKVCQFISSSGSNNAWMKNVLRSQTVGYGATINDNGGTGGGFMLGCGACGVKFTGTDSTVRLATVTAGSTSITLLDTSKCSLFVNGDTFLIAGIDTQGFGDPPNPDRFEWPTIASTAACAGSGVITLTAPLIYTYKSTWPVYNVGRPGLNSDNGGPATAYQLGNTWNSTHAYFGLAIDQQASQTNANGMDIGLYDITCPSTFCVIPSQNLYYRANNLIALLASSEIDKLVTNVFFNNVQMRRLLFQSAEVTNFVCNNCVIGPIGVTGTSRTMIFTNSTLADLSLGATCCGASGALTLSSTAVSSLSIVSANLSNIDTRGVWASGTLTVPANMSISSFANNGSGLIRLTVGSTAGWTNGIRGDGCGGTFAVTVIDSTHVDLQGSTFSTGVCSGTSAFGSLPMSFMVPGANILFNAGSHGVPTGPTLQVADIATGANNATVISFNQNGSPYGGGFPVMPSGAASAYAHPAPSFSCIGCSGVRAVTDTNGQPIGPYGSQATRTITSANISGDPSMPVFGPLTEMDFTVNSACTGASNLALAQTAFTAILGSSSFGTMNPIVNATVASATPRIVTPTGSSGAQSGDTLTPPGAGTILLSGQTTPFYSNTANCATASSVVTVKTNQGVVYP